MTPEERIRLCHKRWLNRAVSLRAQIQEKIALVLHKPTREIEFTAFELTRETRSRFAEQINKNEEIIIPNRSAAIFLVTTQLGQLRCSALLLQDHCDESGMIKLDFNEAIVHIGDILTIQNEYFGVISHDGSAGACISVEEGIAPNHPRHVTLWRSEKNCQPSSACSGV
jgi:hypothetical protein